MSSPGYIKNFWLILLLCVYTINGQIAVTNNAPFDNAQNLVEDVLLGQGIVANNFTWQNGPQNIGYFDGFSSNIGFDDSPHFDPSSRFESNIGFGHNFNNNSFPHFGGGNYYNSYIEFKSRYICLKNEILN